MTNPSDLLIEVQFLTHEEGGWRQAPITGDRTLRPILQIEGCPKPENFVCCLYLEDADGVIQLGTQYKMRMDLLSPQLVIPMVQVGSKFELLENGVIARGHITWVRKLSDQELATIPKK